MCGRSKQWMRSLNQLVQRTQTQSQHRLAALLMQDPANLSAGKAPAQVQESMPFLAHTKLASLCLLYLQIRFWEPRSWRWHVTFCFTYLQEQLRQAGEDVVLGRSRAASAVRVRQHLLPEGLAGIQPLGGGTQNGFRVCEHVHHPPSLQRSSFLRLHPRATAGSWPHRHGSSIKVVQVLQTKVGFLWGRVLLIQDALPNLTCSTELA